MADEEFEWDEDKARANWAKHRVDFEFVKKVFTDVNAIEDLDIDSDPDEERVILTGMADGRLLVVVYTRRGDRIRIISARGATRHEQDEYYRANAP
jgi:uncharacterized DUF497 family protein